MVGGILLIGEDELTVDDIGPTEHVLLLGHQFLPAVDTRLTDIGCHDTPLGSPVVGVEPDTIAVVVDRTVLIVHVGSHLDELRFRFRQVTHEEVVARACS